jgi:hypothetical protein
MFWKLYAGRLKVAVAIAAVAVIAGAVTIVSAHPGPVAPGVIHSCVNNSSGTIKIVSAATTCKNNETAVDWNAQGAPGADGEDGEDGTDGTDGVSGYERVVDDEEVVDVPRGIAAAMFVDCPAGKKVVGGGGQAPGEAFYMLESYPTLDTRWFVRWINGGAVDASGLMTVYAICVIAP